MLIYDKSRKIDAVSCMIGQGNSIDTLLTFINDSR